MARCHKIYTLTESWLFGFWNMPVNVYHDAFGNDGKHLGFSTKYHNTCKGEWTTPAVLRILTFHRGMLFDTSKCLIFFFLNQLKHQMTLRCILMFITCPKILKNIIRWLCVKDLLLHTCWLWSVKLFINVSPWDLHSDLADTFPNSLRIKCFLFTTKFIYCISCISD